MLTIITILYDDLGIMDINRYYPTTFRDVITIKQIFTIHYFEYTKDFSIEGEKHDFWELCYVDNGIVEVIAGQNHHVLFKGDIIFHEPNEFHGLKASGRTAPNLMVLSFSCSSPAMQWFVSKVLHIRESERNLMGHILYEAKQGFLPPFGDPTSSGLRRTEEQPFGCEQIIRIYLEELLISLVRMDYAVLHPRKRTNTITQGITEDVFGKVVKYMLDNLMQNISLEDICQTTGYSRSYLHNVFKERTGRSVAEYHKRLRLEMAKQMIREGRKNFSEIVAAMNYSTLQHFSRIFKRYIGMTPKEYAASAKLNSEFAKTEDRIQAPGPLGQL